MLARHIRLAGVRLIEAAISSKTAAPFGVPSSPTISAPSLSSLKAKKTKELNPTPTASAAVPKVVTAPST